MYTVVLKKYSNNLLEKVNLDGNVLEEACKLISIKTPLVTPIREDICMVVDESFGALKRYGNKANFIYDGYFKLDGKTFHPISSPLWVCGDVIFTSFKGNMKHVVLEGLSEEQIKFINKYLFE